MPLLCTLLLVLGGCVTASVGMASSNIPLEGRSFQTLGTAETTVTWWSIDMGIIGLPLSRPPVDDAIRDLLGKKGGDALINIRYSTNKAVLLLLFSRHSFHLQADVVKLLPPKIEPEKK